mmetsp:Transcript_13987/g.26808  ORF Transcript_13987/g.26808 Transcript_13987/m.26808 type:complete len:257 (+) Transcript_13987:168-938(+)
MSLERRVLQESQVGNQHHSTRFLVAVLRASLGGLFRFISFFQQIREVCIVKLEWFGSPWSIKSRSVQVAMSHSVSPTQSNNILVGETLGVEDFPQVINFLVPIGQASTLTFHRLGAVLGILTTKTSLDGGSSHDFDGNVGCQSPKIRIRNLIGHVLVSNWLQQTDGNVWQTSVGTKGSFSCIGETHHCVGATTGTFLEDTSIVPAQTNQNWTTALFLDKVGNVGFDRLKSHEGLYLRNNNTHEIMENETDKKFQVK